MGKQYIHIGVKDQKRILWSLSKKLVGEFVSGTLQLRQTYRGIFRTDTCIEHVVGVLRIDLKNI